jgi:predicted RNase H-like nuclease
MLEVYPHASHVAGFGLLKERLKYKKGRLADRLQWLAVYRDCLAAHVERLSPGAWPAIALALPPTDSGLGGRALKSVEDRMDAATCALAGFLAWRDGVTPCELFGEPTEGYIVVPGLREDGRFSRCREY